MSFVGGLGFKLPQTVAIVVVVVVLVVGVDSLLSLSSQN